MTKKYEAFISYSREKDSLLSFALHRGLRKYGRPWHGLSQGHVFLDKEILPAGQDLSSALQKALDESKYFVLIASTGAGTSTHVNHEVEFWLENHDVSTILIVLSEGNLSINNLVSEECNTAPLLPPSLAASLTSVPLYVDMRWTRGLSVAEITSDNKYDDAIASLLAPIRGVEKNQISGDQLREQKNLKRIRNGVAIGVLILLSVITIILILYSNELELRTITQEKLLETRDQEAIAQQEVIIAQNKSLGEAALRSAQAGDVELAASLALSAIKQQIGNNTGSALAALYEIQKHPEPKKIFQKVSGSILSLATDEIAKLVAVGTDNGDIFIFDRKTGRKIYETRIEGYVTATSFINKSSVLVATSISGSLSFIDYGTGDIDIVTRKSGLSTLEIDQSRKRIYTGDYRGHIIAWDMHSRRPVKSFKGLTQGDVVAIDLSKNGEYIIGLSRFGNICVWKFAKTTKCSYMKHVSDGITLDLAIHPNKTEIAIATSDGKVVIWDFIHDKEVALNSHIGYGTSVDFNDTGNLLVVATGDNITIWDMRTLSEQYSFRVDGSGIRVNLIPKSRRMIISTSQGRIMEWNIPLFNNGKYRLSNFFTDSRNNEYYLVASIVDGTVEIVDIATNLKLIAKTALPEEPTIISWTEDLEAVLIGGKNGGIYRWYYNSGREPEILVSLNSEVVHLEKVNDSRGWIFLDGSGVLGRLFELHAVWEINKFTTGVTHVTIAPDGKGFVSSHESESSKLWVLDLDTAIEIVTFPETIQGPYEFSSQFVAAGDKHGSIRIFNRQSGHSINDHYGHIAEVTDIISSPMGFASISLDGTTRFWDVNLTTATKVYGPENVTLTVIDTDNSNSLIAIGSNDGRIWLRHLGSGVLLDTFRFSEPTDIVKLQFVGDGSKLVVLSSSGYLGVWDTKTVDEDFVDWLSILYPQNTESSVVDANQSKINQDCTLLAMSAQNEHAVPITPIIVQADYRGAHNSCLIAMQDDPNDLCLGAELGVILRTDPERAEEGFQLIRQSAKAGCENALDYLYNIRIPLAFSQSAYRGILMELISYGSDKAAVELIEHDLEADNINDLEATQKLLYLAREGNPWAHITLAEWASSSNKSNTSYAEAIYHYTVASELSKRVQTNLEWKAAILARRSNLANEMNPRDALSAYRLGLNDAQVIIQKDKQIGEKND